MAGHEQATDTVLSAVIDDPALFAVVPMDFYFPGKGKSGDLPPRRDFAPRWHSRILAAMPDIALRVLVGAHAQRYYLAGRAKANLTQTVRSYREYLPAEFPLVHPSPLNYGWHAHNPWFTDEVVPALARQVSVLLGRTGAAALIAALDQESLSDVESTWVLDVVDGAYPEREPAGGDHDEELTAFERDLA